jgi:hypothetical protein
MSKKNKASDRVRIKREPNDEDDTYPSMPALTSPSPPPLRERATAKRKSPDRNAPSAQEQTNRHISSCPENEEYFGAEDDDDRQSSPPMLSIRAHKRSRNILYAPIASPILIASNERAKEEECPIESVKTEPPSEDDQLADLRKKFDILESCEHASPSLGGVEQLLRCMEMFSQNEMPSACLEEDENEESHDTMEHTAPSESGPEGTLAQYILSLPPPHPLFLELLSQH